MILRPWRLPGHSAQERLERRNLPEYSPAEAPPESVEWAERERF